MCVIVQVEVRERVVESTRFCWRPRPSDEHLGKGLKGASCGVDV